MANIYFIRSSRLRISHKTGSPTLKSKVDARGLLNQPLKYDHMILKIR